MENSLIFSRKKFTMEKFLSQVKVTTQSPVKKILSTSARSFVSASECNSGVVTVSGRTYVNVVYLSDDGRIERAGADVEFIEKQQSSYQLADLVCKDMAASDVQAFSNTEIMLSIAHNVTVSGVYNYELANFEDAGKDLVLNKKSFSGMRLASLAQDNFVVAEECESNITNMSILQADASVVVSEISCTLDKVVVEGKVLADVFESDGENFGLVSKEFEFKQEIAAENVTPNMKACGEVIVKNITVTPEEKDDKTNLVFAIDLYAKVYAYEETTYDAVVDMFSLSSEIVTKNDLIETKNYHSFEVASDNITLQANVSNIENFDDILGVYMGKVYVNSIQDDGDRATISGNAVALALCRANGEINALNVENSTNFEVAKEQEFEIDGVNAELQISSFKVKAGKELEISAKVIYTISYAKSSCECFVSGFDAIKEKPENEGGVKVYVASKGETLFGVAKALSVRPEIISSQNDLPEILEQGEKIYIYSPINLI